MQQVVQEIQRRLVGPVQVFQHHHDRRQGRERGGDVARDQIATLRRGKRSERCVGVASKDAQSVAARRHPGESSDPRSKRRRRVVGGAPALEPGAHGAASGLLQQPALARSGFRDQEQCTAVGLDSRQRGQLRFATYHPAGASSASLHRGRSISHQQPGGQRLSSALDLEPAEMVEVEGVLGQIEGRLPHHAAARWSVRLETLGHVHRVAQDVVVGPDVARDQSRHHRPGVDADPQRQPRGLVGRGGEEGRKLGQHLLGAAHRSCRVVLVSHRCSEVGQERVTREGPDVAVAALHDAHERGQDRVDHLGERLRIQTAGQRGEAREVGEHRRDQSTLLWQFPPAGDEFGAQLIADQRSEYVVDLGAARVHGGARLPAEGAEGVGRRPTGAAGRARPFHGRKPTARPAGWTAWSAGRPGTAGGLPRH
ncbi:unannotated protein [freshwater metagenome]|uniref:Unannotated protein n=1 Tax=freshwater metagenome TaxID=449393 RepID=A0A6J6S9Q5_9ZZZZ